MKKIFLALAFLLALAQFSYGQSVPFPGSVHATAAASGNLWNESFEGTGYELGTSTPGWSENTTGGTVVEDATTNPTNGTQSLRVSQTSTGNYYPSAIYNHNTAPAITYTTFDVTVVSSDLPARSTSKEVLRMYDADSAYVAAIMFYSADGITFYWQVTVWYSNNYQGWLSYDDNVTLSLGATYTLQFKYDATNGAINFSVDGVSKKSATGLTGMRTGTQYWRFGDGGFGDALFAVDIDYIQVDSVSYKHN